MTHFDASQVVAAQNDRRTPFRRTQIPAVIPSSLDKCGRMDRGVLDMPRSGSNAGLLPFSLPILPATAGSSARWFCC